MLHALVQMIDALFTLNGTVASFDHELEVAKHAALPHRLRWLLSA